MNIFFRELKAYRNSTIIWIVSLSLLAVVFLSIFPIFTKDVETTKKLLENIPPAMASAVGLSIGSLFSIYGFMSWLLTFITIAGAVQAMNLGVGVLSKEETGKTADFLLTKPISRTRIIFQKLLAILCLIIITNIAFCVIAFAAAVTVSSISFSVTTFLLILLKLILIQTIFLALGFLLSVIIPKVKSSIAISLPTVFTLFIIGTLGEVLNLESVRYISPFRFFDSNYIINHNAYELKYLVIEFIFVIAAITFAYFMYTNKDIKAAS